MQPEKKFRAGLVTATIWINKGEKGEYPTVSICRAYMDKNNAWKETNSYRVSDLPKLALVLAKSYEHLQLKGQSEIEVEAVAV